LRASLPDSSILATALQALEFIGNIRNSSTEYDAIGKHRDARILLSKEGARRTYGLKAEEAIGKRNSEVLQAIEDVSSGRSHSGFFQDRGRPAGVGLFELQRPQKLGAPAWAGSPIWCNPVLGLWSNRCVFSFVLASPAARWARPAPFERTSPLALVCPCGADRDGMHPTISTLHS